MPTGLSSLRLRVLLVLGAVLALVMTVATYRAYERRESDVAVALARLQERADALAGQQSEVFRSTRSLVEALTLGGAFGPGPTCADALARFLARNPALENIGLARPDGEVMCIALGSDKVKLGDREYIHRALEDTRVVMGEPAVGPVSKRWVLPFAQAIRDDKGRPRSVLIAVLNLEGLGAAFADLPGSRDARFGVVSQSGIVMSHHPDPGRMVGQDISATPFFRNIVDKSHHGTGEEAGLDGEPRVYAFSPFAQTPAGPVILWVSLYKSEVTAAAERQFRAAVLLAALIALAAFSLVWLFWEYQFARPMAAISRTAQRLAAGDYLARTGVMYRRDELGTLAELFDRMAVSLASNAEILRLNRAFRVLSSCGTNLVRAQSEQELLDGVCQTIVEAGQYRMAWIGLIQRDEAKSVHPAAYCGEGAADYLEEGKISWGDNERGRGPTGRAIRLGTTQVEQDMIDNPASNHLRATALAHGYRGALSLPLKDHGETFGTLTIYAAQPGAFDSEETGLLQELADDLSFGIVAQRSAVERRRAEERADRLAKFDTATDLPNRVEMIAHLGKAIERAAVSGGRLAVAELGMDRLSDVQDAIGIAGVDDVLRQLATRLSGGIGGIHFVARNGAEAFASVVPLEVQDPADVAWAVRALCEAPFEYSGIPIDLQVTVGVAMYPDHGDSADALLRRADIAVRRARSEGSAYAVYSGAVDSENPQNLVLLADLRKGIREGELVLFYQGKVSTVDGSVASAEALVRWRHPTRGMVPPYAFIGLAERTGLIKPLTYAVIEAALTQLAEWQRQGSGLRVAVNVSPNNLRDPEFLEQLIAMPARLGARLDMLDMEITETALMEDPTRALEVLAKLAELGVRVFIDDFGTGYSSLAYLATLPIHALKIDRSFVIRMDQPRYCAIVESTISMAHALGMKVVAEGVETKELAQMLADRGCDEIQGFLYSKPVPADEFVNWRAGFTGSKLAA